MAKKLRVKDLLSVLNLEVVHGNDYLDKEVTRPVVSRPGVEIYSNYFDFYEHNRIQVLGTKEMNLFYMVDEAERPSRVDRLFSYLPPAFIFTHNVSEIPNEFITSSDKYQIPILKSPQTTTTCISALGGYLSEELAIKKSFHGVMMDINGVGVMLTGKSRMGKSETALQLLKLGHTLISDDRVDIAEPSVGILVASCPKMIERLMEVRGIGLIWGLDVHDEALAKNISKEAFKAGLIVERAGRKNEVVKIMPPLVIEDDVLKKGLEIFKESVKKVM